MTGHSSGCSLWTKDEVRKGGMGGARPRGDGDPGAVGPRLLSSLWEQSLESGSGTDATVVGQAQACSWRGQGASRGWGQRRMEETQAGC